MELGVGDGREEKRDSDELLDAPTAAGWVELRDGGRKEEVGVIIDVTKKRCDEAMYRFAIFTHFHSFALKCSKLEPLS